MLSDAPVPPPRVLPLATAVPVPVPIMAPIPADQDIESRLPYDPAMGAIPEGQQLQPQGDGSGVASSSALHAHEAQQKVIYLSCHFVSFKVQSVGVG